MKAILCLAVVCFLLVHSGGAQKENVQPHKTLPSETHALPASPKPDSDDMEQMRADLQRLKILLNQMRTNLAFVQTSQTPLKHQFELETDAWQVIVEQMERRLKRMEDRTHESAR